MHVLVIGGAGLVGSTVVPHLAARHRVRVLDRRVADASGVESVVGDVRSADDVAAAVEGVDGVVHLAAGFPTRHDDAAGMRAAFELNVASLHLTAVTAAAAGVSALAHVSSMSVFADYAKRRVDTTAAPDAADPYGLTKRLGEQVLAALAPSLGMAVSSLRLVYPTTDEAWPEWASSQGGGRTRVMRMRGGPPIPSLAASDLAAAIERALEYRGPYRAFSVTADVTGVSVVPDDTQSVLAWSPVRVPGWVAD
ncbi:NAD-dependent epimerase/dehydratase family protein [Jiangella mangrovi]|uniref:Nucleoside-diphosphate-sugar epimerase n=1 Tax=Jiangella mangrovi TaxID=1524084 RepID=A0A7W9GS61_9ACTN|nr:NAD(P)-dependent oxidoreductase [Jiangella mangrovi]MBB5789065.1 nucleoside-diphosphate-sugar epimerase [Jiangella mangrovi]